MKSNYMSDLVTEPGMFYLVGILSLIFAMWLVVNFESLPIVFFGYAVVLLASFVYRFMTKEKFFASYELFSSKISWDLAAGFGFALLWFFVILPSPYGILPLPPLPTHILATSPAAFLIVVILAPIAEEYYFRGSLLPQISKITGNQVLALFASAFLFGAFHWGAYLQGALSSAVIASILFGLFVGALTLWRKSILPGIIVHSIVNFAILSPNYAMII